MKDFSLGKYEALCAALAEAGYRSQTIGGYLESAGAPPLVLLRHDVESDPWQAVRMARVERRHGLLATYFFRVKARPYDLSAIAPIVAEGHEIGYHYETLSQARGDRVRARALFLSALATLRRHAPVRVASMHGSPMLPWDNRAIWDEAAPADFGLLGEVYRDIDYSRVAYFTDTGRTWHPRRYNIRDRAPVPPGDVVETTDELIALLRSGRLGRVSILTHPERWPATTVGWAARAVRDAAENLGKVAVSSIYKMIWK